MSEIPSRHASVGMSFGVKQLMRKEAVELAVLNEQGAAILPYLTLT
jgi:hypothetical protein